jgi:hypothetical protein
LSTSHWSAFTGARASQASTDLVDAGKTARFSMLETLADHDDELME